MGQEDEFDIMKPESAKESVENIAEYLEKHPSMDEMIFNKIVWDYPYASTKKDFTHLAVGASGAVLKLINAHIRDRKSITKKEFYATIGGVIEAFEL